MTDLNKLGIHRCIRTGKMSFVVDDEDDYSPVESKIVEMFKSSEFFPAVQIHTSDDEFLVLYLSGDTVDVGQFHNAALWLIATLEELGASLDSVEAHAS